MTTRSKAGPARVLVYAGILALAVSACGRSDRQSAADRPASPAGSGGPVLRDGFYPVLIEAATPDSARVTGRAHVVLPYDDRYSEPSERGPRTYVAIDTTSWVPLILEGLPEARPDGSGRTLLGVTLQERYVKPLEDFTTRHLGGRVAILLDGEIVTMHKIRAVIREGKIQITRCDDNACEVLFSKLTREAK